MDKETLLQHHRNILRLKVIEGVKEALQYAAVHKVPCSKKNILYLQSYYKVYYQSLLQDNIPKSGQILSLNSRIKFLSNLSINPFDKEHSFSYIRHNCWLWTAGVTHDGYGRMRVGQERHDAHVLSYNLFCRVTHHPSKDTVLSHSCDNPPCCNPYHLSSESQRVNVLDMEQKGRSRYYGNRSVADEAENYMDMLKELKD